MKLSGKELEKLTGILREAYRAKERLPVGEQWQDSVMVRIRHMGTCSSAPGYLPTFEHLVWRLAPATSLLMAVLAALSFAMNALFEYDIVQLVLTAVEDSALVHLFGV
ncbi:MAG TPA: hypothetical protein VMT71_08510 [Syntrophorhabdales bacterium]|nr:hypothetical protein [Syntrophorhabdales bacterium]